jgi:hypothetical protein
MALRAFVDNPRSSSPGKKPIPEYLAIENFGASLALEMSRPRSLLVLVRTALWTNNGRKFRTWICAENNHKQLGWTNPCAGGWAVRWMRLEPAQPWVGGGGGEQQ